MAKNFLNIDKLDFELPLKNFRVLTPEVFECWIQCPMWDLFSAILITMDLNPNAVYEECVDEETALKYGKEYLKRKIVLREAADQDQIVLFERPLLSPGHDDPETFSRQCEVDAKQFIKWSIENGNLYPEAIGKIIAEYLPSMKSLQHSRSAGHKGDAADRVKEQIAEKAIQELEAGCRCHNPDLARYLMKLKNGDGTSMFILPGIVEGQYEHHFNIATKTAFKAMNIPLRNEPKAIGVPPRGKRHCSMPGHNN